MADNPFAVERRFYVNVPAYTVSVDEYVIPLGDILALAELGGNAFGSIDSQVKIIWDDGGDQQKVLVVTHGDTVQATQEVLTGDGSKKLKIALSNNLSLIHI